MGVSAFDASWAGAGEKEFANNKSVVATEMKTSFFIDPPMVPVALPLTDCLGGAIGVHAHRNAGIQVIVPVRAVCVKIQIVLLNNRPTTGTSPRTPHCVS